MENIETLLAAVAQTQGFDDDDEPVVSTAPEKGLDNSESSAVVPGDAHPSAVVDVPPPPLTPAIPAVGRVICAGEKRKRGRPRKRQLVMKPSPKRNKPEDEEEDVCFICFDGGYLVLCDRKGCPKAYHPTCIKRDEAFFKSKAKWNCGCHICSVCLKASYYMCYTCTYSLCKKCTKDAEYLCVRGNKGFCSTCMKTIMLIEKQYQANDEVQIDFDDETSWEYLFKAYWVVIKEKLSLTLSDLTRAKKPWKGVATIDHKPLSGNVVPTVDVPSTYSCTEHLELNKPHVETNSPLPSNYNHVDKLNDENGRLTKPSMDGVMLETSVVKATNEPGIEKDQDTLNTTGVTDKPCICKNMNGKESENLGIDRSTQWATKDLLEFVAHLKNGDMSAISRIDMQTLLLDYINRNNLWDPRRKSQIICDPTLGNLFGKPRVGHIEMLKLLESRFLVKEDFQKDTFIPAGFVSSVKRDMEVDESEEDIRSDDNSKKGKEEIYVQERSITNEKTEDVESNSTDKYTDQANIPNLATDDRNDQKDIQRSELENTTTSASVGNSPSSNIIEIEKLWHYRDPDGKIRGPFSMMQLREWSTTGLYLPDMRIWTNHEQYDSLRLDDALNGNFHGASDLSNSGSREEGANGEIGVISEGTNVSGGDSKQIEAPSNNVSGISEDNNGVVRADESGTRPQCWDFLKDNNYSGVNNDVQARNLLPSSSPGKKHEALPDCGQESNGFYPKSQNGKMNNLNPRTGGHEVENKSNNEYQVGLLSDENMRSSIIDLSSNDMGLSKSGDSNKKGGNISILDFPSPTRPNTAKNRQPVPSDIPVQNSRFLELLSLAPRSGDEVQAGQAFETKKSGLNFSMPNSDQIWNGVSGLGVGPVQIPILADDWCKFPSAFSLKPPEITCDNPTSNSASHHQISPSHSHIPNWLADINEPIEFDALGEEYVSDLLAEVDAMESQGPLHSPTSAIKFAREFLEDCKDGCFGSIEEFSSTTPCPRKSDTLSSTSETQLNSPSCKPMGGLITINSFDSLARSNVHSSTSSEGETNTACLEFHPHAPNAAQDMIGASLGNINLVTVQGNVNLVLGGPAGQGMENLGWGTNPGTSWVNSNLNHGPVNENLLPWDGQRKYNGERYTSPREWGYQGGRPPWGRQPTPYGGGGHSRPLIPKGQRVCKFYESGRCKKGAFCDYLHP